MGRILPAPRGRPTSSAVLLFVSVAEAVPTPLLASDPGPKAYLEELCPGHLLATPADCGRARACVAAVAVCPRRRRLPSTCRFPPPWTITPSDLDWDKLRPSLWFCGDEAAPLAFSSLER